MPSYLQRPPIRQLVVAARHAREAVDGNTPALVAQAEALLRADGYQLAKEDRRTLTRLIESAAK